MCPDEEIDVGIVHPIRGNNQEKRRCFTTHFNTLNKNKKYHNRPNHQGTVSQSHRRRRYVLHELRIGLQLSHRLGCQHHLQVDAPVAFSPRKRRDLAVEFVRGSAPDRQGPAPPEIVVVHRESRRAPHGHRRAVEVSQREQPRLALPTRHSTPHRCVIVRHHVAVEQIAAPAQVPRQELADRRDGRDALDRVAEVVRVHPRL
jgi:hypothetical protein